MQNSVANNIQAIQRIFRDVQENFPETYNLQTLAEKLDTYEVKFRSIAYEAASFCIALKDIDTFGNLHNWKFFLNEIGKPHATQIHVGLGWALAQKQIEPAIYLTQLEPALRYRVLDGYGYYEGVFRKRKSVLGMQKFETKDTAAVIAYDQGLGRCLWYGCMGEIDEAKIVIEKFPAERQKDLWRGLGIAIAYVGGFSERKVEDILQKAATHKIDLAEGASRALHSRKESGCGSEDTELFFRIANS